MQLTFEKNGISNSVSLTPLLKLEEILNQIDPFSFPYVVLTNENKDYIQCAGSKNAMAIEARFYNNGTFKHFVLGRELMSKVWDRIECKVGPIDVLSHEVMDLNNAIILFKSFFLTGSIPQNYNKRNITRQFV